MATLKKTIARTKKFDFEKAILKVVRDNDNIAIDLNVGQLGEKGIDSVGVLLPGPYAPFTIDSKRGQSGFGGITGHITLYGEGSFHDKFFVEASSFPVKLDSADSKTGKLKSDWGEDIFGHTKDSQSEFNEEILPDIQASLKRGLL